MTKKTDEKLLLDLLSTYTSGVTNSLETVAAMNGVSFRSVYTWLRDPEITVSEFMGEQNITFGKAMNLARNVSKVLTVGRSLEDRVLNGLKIQVWHHGAPSYVDCEIAAAATDEELKTLVELGVCWPDKKKRILNPETGIWERIIATRIESPPAQLVECYARANMPSIYGQKSEVTMKGQVQLGVQVVGSRGPVPPEALPYATAADLASTVTETVLLPRTAGPGDAPDGDGSRGPGEARPEVYEAADEALDELLGLDEVSPERTTDTEPDEPAPTLGPEPAVPSDDPGAYTAAPAERETSPPANPMLSIAPGWRSEYQALLDRNATDGANARRRMVR